MSRVPYSSAIGSLMYDMICTRPDCCYAMSLVSRYQSNIRKDHLKAVKRMIIFQCCKLTWLMVDSWFFMKDISRDLFEKQGKALGLRIGWWYFSIVNWYDCYDIIFYIKLLNLCSNIVCMW